MDSEPSLAYQNVIPVVAWVRDADRNLGTLTDRKIAYRALNGLGSVTIPGDLPAGAVEPSLAADTVGNLRLAFTVATDAGGLVGNQRQLYFAAQSCSGSCSWSVQALTDWHGRAIHAEGPKLTLNNAGQGTILYRGLGMGPLPGGGNGIFKEDALGIIQGTGEVAKVAVSASSAKVSPLYMTQDGQNKWQVNSVFDTLTGQTIVTAAFSGGGLLASNQVNPLMATQMAAQFAPQSEPVIGFSTPDLPDYAIDSALPSAEFVPPGSSLSLEVGIVNLGITATQPITVETAWDGPPGTGLPAGAMALKSPAPGQTVTGTLDIDLSPVNLSVPHQLYVVVNPYQDTAEASFDNNTSILNIGGLSVPTDLKAAAKTGSSLVFLSWTTPRDARIIGFRIYRFDANGVATPVGSSFEPDFADLFASLDTQYQYGVTSFDEQGIESTMSNKVDVNPVSLAIFLPIIQRGR